MADQAQKPKTVTTQPDTFESGMAQAASPSETYKKQHPVPPLHFPKIVGDGIASVMESRNNMRGVEQNLVTWKNFATPEEIAAAKISMQSARLAMESLCMLFGQITA